MWNAGLGEAQAGIKIARRNIALLTKVHYFADKQSYGFSSRVWMWKLDHKEGSALKNWCFWTVVLGKTLESPLDIKEIKAVCPKGNQSWIFIGRTDVEAPIFLATCCEELTPSKRPWCWKSWGQEEKGITNYEMVGWRHWLELVMDREA